MNSDDSPKLGQLGRVVRFGSVSVMNGLRAKFKRNSSAMNMNNVNNVPSQTNEKQTGDSVASAANSSPETQNLMKTSRLHQHHRQLITTQFS